jgi:hypothetical protein
MNTHTTWQHGPIEESHIMTSTPMTQRWQAKRALPHQSGCAEGDHLMSFLERLKKLEHVRTHPTKPTKPPQGAEKVGFVGFVAPYLASVEVFSPPSPRAANDSPPCTDPKNRGIEAHYKNSVVTNPAHVGTTAAQSRNSWDTPIDPDTTAAQDWAELDKAYQAHHMACPTCIGAGKGYGLRCGAGAALWAAYVAAGYD